MWWRGWGLRICFLGRRVRFLSWRGLRMSTWGRYRVRRALAGEGILLEHPEGADPRFELTAAGEMLRSDVAGSMRAAALIGGSAG